MTVYFHEEDLPAGVLAPGPVAVDTETMGLLTARDRLCLVQIADGHGDEHLVRFGPDSSYEAPHLVAALADPARLKLYHFARFDLAAIRHYLGAVAAPVYCTKTASRLVRTFTDRHGLKELVREILGQDISKQQQTSDWGGPEINEAQRDYAGGRTFDISIGSKRRSTSASNARAAPPWPRPASISSQPAPSWISPAGPRSISSPMSRAHGRAR